MISSSPVEPTSVRPPSMLPMAVSVLLWLIALPLGFIGGVYFAKVVFDPNSSPYGTLGIRHLLFLYSSPLLYLGLCAYLAFLVSRSRLLRWLRYSVLGRFVLCLLVGFALFAVFFLTA
jgi:hypothetical protein